MSSNARSRLVRRRRRARRRSTVNRTSPTRATAARLRPDPLLVLLRHGRVSREQLDAALDIRRAFELITGPVGMRSMRTISTSDGTTYDPIRGPRSSGPSDETVRQVAVQRRFGDWAAAMHEQQLPIGPVIDLVVEGKSGRSVDRERGRRNGWAVELLVHALDLFITAPPRPAPDVKRELTKIKHRQEGNETRAATPDP